MNDPHYKTMTNFLVSMGTEDVPHTEKNYLAHLINVHRLMESEGCDVELCRAGMFHSIYGTETFQRFKLPLERRGELRELIGPRAERLAYFNSAMDRTTFDAAVARTEDPARFRDRITGEEVVLGKAEFDDLCAVHLYDWLEQAVRSRFGWDYRREAYERMARRVGERAVAARQRVYAQETQSQ